MLRLTLPPQTTEVLGEEAAAEFAQWFAEHFAPRDQLVHRDEYREILSRLDILEHDTAGLKTEVAELRRNMDARFDTVHARFDTVHARFDAMEERFDARFDAMEERFDARFDRMQSEMNARFERMQSDINARFDAVNARFDVVNARFDTIHDVVRSQTRWLVGTLIALGGLISVLITIFEFIK